MNDYPPQNLESSKEATYLLFLESFTYALIPQIICITFTFLLKTEAKTASLTSLLLMTATI